MQESKIRFTVELADIPIEIICRYPKNKAFFREYLSDKKPVAFCEPSAEDLSILRKTFFWFEKHEGRVPREPDNAYIENVTLNWLLCELLVSHDVLQLHGSALCMDGEAYIFIAPSGTGKSTHARLWREVYRERVKMINDDKPLLRIKDNGIMVYGSPWDGKHRLSSNMSAPLKALVVLNRGTENRIVRISSQDAFPVIFRQAHTSPNSVQCHKIMKMEDILLKGAPCYRMSCNMEQNAAKTAWAGINNCR